MDTGTAMAALGACRAGRQWQLAPLVIETARQRDVEPSLLLFNALLGVYAAAQQTEKVGGVVDGSGCVDAPGRQCSSRGRQPFYLHTPMNE